MCGILAIIGKGKDLERSKEDFLEGKIHHPGLYAC